MGLLSSMKSEELGIRNTKSVKSDLDLDTDVLIEQIWEDLQGTFDRVTILNEVSSVIPQYASAYITTYLPIFIHRETVKRLKAELRED